MELGDSSRALGLFGPKFLSISIHNNLQIEYTQFYNQPQDKVGTFNWRFTKWRFKETNLLSRRNIIYIYHTSTSQNK